MIETFVINKINQERQIFDDLWGSLPIDEKLSPEKIAKSSLSEFTKNYILNMVEETEDRDEILDRIAKANKLRFNYAIRPKWTLITYLFGNYESRPPSDIAKKLELFPFYNFYIDSINEVLRDNFSIFITRNEVSMIIDETNKAIYRKLTTDINNAKIKNFFLQIYSLKYNEQELNLESTVPYSFLKIFLNDKYYFDIEKKFQLVRGIKDEFEISLKDVIKVLMNKYDFNEREDETKIKDNDEPKYVTEIEKRIQSEEEPKNIHEIPPKIETSVEDKISREEEPEIINRLEPKIEYLAEDKIENEDERKIKTSIESKVETKTESKFERKDETKIETNIEAKVETLIENETASKDETKIETNVEPQIETKSENIVEPVKSRSAKIVEFKPEPKNHEPIQTKEIPLAVDKAPARQDATRDEIVSRTLIEPEDSEKTIDEPVAAVKKLFTDKQFDKILDKVYNSDIEHVARSFMKLSNYKTWFEASNHLKEVFKINGVDIYNKDVINFVDTLNDYYSERG